MKSSFEEIGASYLYDKATFKRKIPEAKRFTVAGCPCDNKSSRPATAPHASEAAAPMVEWGISKTRKSIGSRGKVI